MNYSHPDHVYDSIKQRQTDQRRQAQHHYLVTQARADKPNRLQIVIQRIINFVTKWHTPTGDATTACCDTSKVRFNNEQV